MKVLWITNIPIGDIIEQKLKPMGGLWMDALFKLLIEGGVHSFVIVTSTTTKATICHKINGTKYYLIPGGPPVNYKRNSKKAKNDWEEIFKAERPDVIQVWGTEYSHAVYALMAANNMGIPSVIYIQGVMKAIAKYATGSLRFTTMLRYTTLRDIVRLQLLVSQKSWFKKRANIEKKLISLSGRIVVENRWAESFCKSIYPDVSVYKLPLNINKVFHQERWTAKGMVPYTIMCNASGPAYKGLHILLKALILIRDRFPTVKLYVPGSAMTVGKGLSRQQKPGYYGFVTDFINKNHLKENINFTGYLSQRELAFQLSKAHVFVLPSAVENHSSSLKEAMAVGVPSVASLVGGIPEYFHFGRSGFSYRYEEYECLATYVCELFENIELCEKFSESSILIAQETNDCKIIDDIQTMYNELRR